MSTEDPNPSGRCMCGCGSITSVAAKTSTSRGTVRGKHCRYLPSHSSRHDEYYIAEDRGYETPCWIWQRFTAPTGHARLKTKGADVRGAHVVYYERKYGPVAAGNHVHHLCEQGACVNPDHLVSLTPAQHKQAHSRLSWGTVREIRSRVAAGEMFKDVAASHEISRQSVSDIVYQRTWRETG